MSKELIKQKFQEAKNVLIEYNKRISPIIPINKYLKKFNWAFIHPHLIGAEINYFAELVKNKSGNKDAIFKIFANSFFNLQNTAVLIDGYFKIRPNLKPFCHLIDQSVFMCLERNYAGAINTLLPVIEGSIRHYLINVIGKKNETIMNSKDFFQIFPHLRKDILDRQEDYYKKNYLNSFGISNSFDQSQINELLKWEAKNVDIWFSIIKEYLENSLYLDTRTGNVQDKLNRHSIFHGFNGDIYYNLENYLKIFNCIFFLSWAFGYADKNIGALTNIEIKDIIYKWKVFEKVKIISRYTASLKSLVYEKYQDFDKQEFEQDLICTQIDLAILKISTLEHKLKFIDKLTIAE